MKYDRELLLAGAKRNAVLELAEIHAYGLDSYGSADYVSIHNMRPAEWYSKGIRLLGRTAVECTRDELAERIGADVAQVAGGARLNERPLLIDPFAGSGNTLYWLARHLSPTQTLGFELDRVVFGLTQRNLALLNLPVEMLNVDYRAGLTQIRPDKSQLLVAFIAPPWGDALDPVSGLDLRHTYPPVTDITRHFLATFSYNPILFAIQVHESVNPASVRELTEGFDWSALKIYDLLQRGHNHGVLIATSRWKPPARGSVNT